MNWGVTSLQVRQSLRAAARSRELARGALLAYLALAAAGCGYPRPASLQGPLTGYADFRDRIGWFVASGQIADATALFSATNPSELAIAASSRGDVRYMAVGAGQVLPGITPIRPPSRTWTVPGTRDTAQTDLAVRYQMVAYEFAYRFNETLAAEERGVR